MDDLVSLFCWDRSHWRSGIRSSPSRSRRSQLKTCFLLGFHGRGRGVLGNGAKLWLSIYPFLSIWCPSRWSLSSCRISTWRVVSWSRIFLAGLWSFMSIPTSLHTAIVRSLSSFSLGLEKAIKLFSNPQFRQGRSRGSRSKPTCLT